MGNKQSVVGKACIFKVINKPQGMQHTTSRGTVLELLLKLAQMITSSPGATGARW